MNLIVYRNFKFTRNINDYENNKKYDYSYKDA